MVKMDKMKINIFPNLSGKSWAEVNLDALAQQDFPSGENPLLDPVKCDRWVKDVAKRHGVDFTFGGYLEDRAHLWRGHYLPAGPQAHLGVDYNVPDGTPVASCLDGEVIHIARDGQWGGWGGVLIFKVDAPPVKGADYLYYGHLRWDDTVALGQKVKAGDIVGTIGQPHQNGQWFPHLHVQLVSEAKMRATNGNPLNVDGYMAPPVPSGDFPDPRPLISV
jgi:murein DD-endopeptidase MepM/ murein hydrolase activator NlpD